MLHTFDAVIAVSERDIVTFKKEYGITQSHAIPTGVDLDFFSYEPPSAITPAQPPTVIFTGSMDWAANIDGIKFFLTNVWPKIILALPDARVLIVGRNPPSNLQALGNTLKNVEFTGFVDDIRRYVYSAHAFVIPLLVGGGTRIKAFEAMAMGCPVVSTSIGIEGLDVQEDIHFMQRDDSLSMAAAIVDLLNDEGLRHRLSLNARQLVEQQFGHAVASAAFEQICIDTLSRCGWCRTNEEVGMS